MARDTRKIGVPTQSYDFTVLTNNARVINNHICFSSNVSFSVIELFQIRYKLYKQYYFSREIKATDCMMMDIFSEANDYYNFKEYITNPSKYLELKDNILEEIQHSKEKELEKARSLVRRISENRDLYVFVGETIIFDKEKAEKINEEFFYEITGLDHNMICLFKGKPSSKVNSSSVSLFEKNKAQNSYQVKSMNQDEITHIIPFNFIEYIIRVYCKDKKYLESSKTAFKKFCSIIGEELVE
jgi:HD superfamily phosphohydrolase